MVENADNESGLKDPSVYEINYTDRMEYSFSDISLISDSDINFVAKGVRYGKWFVIKGLTHEYRDDAGARAMLRKEFELLVDLQHPNIRRALNFEDTIEFGPCIIMDYVEGPNLRKWLASKRTLKERMRVASELADAIAYIHGKRIVHRDIKPENVIVSRIGGSPLLIDFGLSDSDGFAILKSPGGTAPYISPEQADSSVPDVKNDIYSFGVLLGELLPERRFSRVIAQCTAPVDKRPENALDIRRRLEWANRRPKILLLLSAGIVLLLIVLFSLLKPQPSPSDKGSSSTDNGIPNLLTADSITPPAAVDAPATAPTITAAEIISAAPQTEPNTRPNTYPSPIEPGSPSATKPESEKPAITAVEKRAATPPSEKSAAKESQTAATGHDAAFNEVLNLGRKTINLCVAEEFEKLDDPAVDPSLLPEKLDSGMLAAIKTNYINGIRINIRTGGVFLEKYPLKIEDADLMDKLLNEHIQECQKKWKELRTKKISNR